MLKILDCLRKINYSNRNISMCRFHSQNDDNNAGAKTSKRKVKETVELITLVDQNDKILGLKPKTEAEKLAKKLNLTLERVTDTKYGKIYPAFKMYLVSDLLKAEQKTTAKVLKKLPLNSRISDHDLTLKTSVIRKWLSKNCEVHVAIARNNESQGKMKSVMDKIQEEIKNECRIVNIRQNEESIKFIVLPPKQISNKATPKSKDENSKDGTS